MLKGFREFLFRGNLIDLAVAVVIGTAFVALVAAFTTYIVNPIIARAGGASGPGWGIQLGDDGNPATLIDVGGFLTAILTFVITAAVVYFAVIVPMRKVLARFTSGAETVAKPDDVVLLTEIRDLLREQRKV